jgi:hypothetical protein
MNIPFFFMNTLILYMNDIKSRLEHNQSCETRSKKYVLTGPDLTSDAYI